MGTIPKEEFFKQIIQVDAPAVSQLIGGTLCYMGDPVDNGANTITDPVLIVSQADITTYIATNEQDEIKWDENTDYPFYFLPLKAGLDDTYFQTQIDKIKYLAKTVIVGNNLSASYQASIPNPDFDGVVLWTNTTSTPWLETDQLKSGVGIISDKEVEGKGFWLFNQALKTYPQIGKFIRVENSTFTSQFQTPAQAMALRNASITAFVEAKEGTFSVDAYIGGKQAQIAYQKIYIKEVADNVLFNEVGENRNYTNTEIRLIEENLRTQLNQKLVDTGIVNLVVVETTTKEKQSASDINKGILVLQGVDFDETERIAYIKLVVKGV